MRMCVCMLHVRGTNGVSDRGGRKDDDFNVRGEETNATLENNKDLYTWEEDKLEEEEEE